MKHTAHHQRPLLTLCTLLGALLAPVAAFAQRPIKLLEPIGSLTEITPGPFPLSPLNQYLQVFIPWVIGVGAGLCVLMIVVGGFQIMLSGGEATAQGAGKNRILSALMGLLILVFSAMILNFLNANYYRLIP